MARYPIDLEARISVNDFVWLTAYAKARGISVSQALRETIAAARQIEAFDEGDNTRAATLAENQSAYGSALAD
jgi:hypothetical protein